MSKYSDIDHLTRKQKALWRLLVKGYDLAQCSKHYNVTHSAIKSMARDIYAKMNVHSQTQLIFQNWYHPDEVSND